MTETATLSERTVEVKVGEAVERLAFELYRRVTTLTPAQCKEHWSWLPMAARRQWTEQALEYLIIALALEAK
jgi:hypothetical protein